MPNLKNWRSTWTELGVRDPGAGLFHDLITRYAEPHRKYHTVRHLVECFTKFDEIRAEARHAAEIELALWFHDAIYDVQRNDNEARSADWARSSALAEGLARTVADRLYALVMATRHEATPVANDEQILVDVDLSILAAPADRFDEYEQQIRDEYAVVPDRLFRRRRAKLLQQFLRRPAIFNTQRFFDVYESRARMNLERSIKRLVDG